MSELFAICRELNVVLGPLAVVALAYRSLIGRADEKIVYFPLFLIFIGYVLVTALGAPTAIHVGNSATWLSPCLTFLHVSLIVVCFWLPGPLRKGSIP